MEEIFTLRRGEGPLVATALHHGHAVRPDVGEALALDASARLREEDPHTGLWTSVAPNRVVLHRSRFEVDMNRPPEEAVYPTEVWGLRVWKDGPAPDAVRRRSLEEYRAFYAAMEALFADLAARHGRFLVLDLHTYNHRREGPTGPEADPGGNPDVNLGTGSMDRALWGDVADAFLDSLAGLPLLGRRLDVRENVRFQGGWFSRWVHERFPGAGCALAIEVKKFFMDEWTGRAPPGAVEAVREALARAVPPMMRALGAMEVARR